MSKAYAVPIFFSTLSEGKIVPGDIAGSKLLTAVMSQIHVASMYEVYEVVQPIIWSLAMAYICSKLTQSPSWLTCIHTGPLYAFVRNDSQQILMLSIDRCPLTAVPCRSAVKGRYYHRNDSAMRSVLHHFVQQKSLAWIPCHRALFPL